jgi:hypothetical protein
LVLGDSSSDPTPPAAPPPAATVLSPPAATPAVLTIKDKALDLGIKDVMDEETWLEAKKIIDTHLSRHPYSPGPYSKKIAYF